MWKQIVHIDNIDRFRKAEEPTADLEKFGAFYGKIDVTDYPFRLFRGRSEKDDPGHLRISFQDTFDDSGKQRFEAPYGRSSAHAVVLRAPRVGF